MDEATLEPISRFGNLKIKWRRLSQGRKILICIVGLLLIGLGSLSAYTSYSYWFWNKKEPIDQSELLGMGSSTGKEGTPQEQQIPSPINGIFYSARDASVWKKRRPLGISMENHIASRPPYGLPQAEIIYEAVAEGGITRFLAVYLCSGSERLEPIRSARTYFLDWASEFDGIFVHWGGANSSDPRTDALGNIVRFGIANLNCLTSPELCWRDTERYAPHNGVSSTEHLWKKAQERGLSTEVDFDSWQFKEEASSSARPTKQSILFDFWGDADYTVKWEYDALNNEYLRFNGRGGTEIHKDSATNEQLRAKNVIIQEVVQGVVDDGTEYPHLAFETIGEGKALVFLDGVQIEATWKKPERKERTRYYEATSLEEIKFNRGQIWVEVLPPGNIVTVG